MTDIKSAAMGQARSAGFTIGLLVLAVGLVLGGILLPSPKVDPPTTAAYRALKSPTAPVRLVVRSLKINAPVVPIALSSDAVLDPPRDVHQVGWWNASAKPGSRVGQTVITGHTVHTGGGTMDHIGTLRHGATVDVVTKRGTLRYRVERVKTLSKEAVAKRAVGLFGQQSGTGRLVLITCTDWNGSFYESNVIVFGTPLGIPVQPKKSDTVAKATAR